jgi:predicted amidohydrolase
MKVNVIEFSMFWEDKMLNLQSYNEKLSNIKESDLVVLPEMFQTGFSMSPELYAEKMDGETISWMKNWSYKLNSAICGSLMVVEDKKFYNRFVFVKPDGSIQYYDKRHLFSFGDEDKHYTPGNTKTIIEWKGFKILPLICYDLRFPVWSRNVGDYDMIIYVANWPESRSLAWKTLLKARAIENQSYVIGCNRVGIDGRGIKHSGDSMIISPLGEITNQVSIEEVRRIRTQFPFLDDKDLFEISI